MLIKEKAMSEGQKQPIQQVVYGTLVSQGYTQMDVAEVFGQDAASDFSRWEEDQ